MTLFFALSIGRDGPGELLWAGGICSIVGLALLRKWWDQDTLLPGTTFTHLPRWTFFVGGLLMQIPLPLAWWWLKSL